MTCFLGSARSEVEHDQWVGIDFVDYRHVLEWRHVVGWHRLALRLCEVEEVIPVESKHPVNLQTAEANHGPIAVGGSYLRKTSERFGRLLSSPLRVARSSLRRIPTARSDVPTDQLPHTMAWTIEMHAQHDIGGRARRVGAARAKQS